MHDPRHVAPTLAEAIRRLEGVEQRGFVFVRDDGTERYYPFAELVREAEQRAAGLRARGLAKGDRLAIVVPESEEFVLAFLGAVLAGVVPVPISPQLSFKSVETYHETVAHIVKASGASLLLTTESTLPYVEPVAGRVPTLGGIVKPGDLREASIGSARARDRVDVQPSDVAFLQFTSGSTSRPKGVVVTHRNLAWNSESFMVHGLRKDSSFDKGVSWLPLFHDMGLIGFVIGPIFTDIPVVFLPTASFVRNPRCWLDAIHRHRGTITYAPNFAYALVTKRLKGKDVSDLDLSCLRRTGCGAEPIQASTLRAFAETLRPAGFDPRSFLPSYGMAEATLAITFVPPDSGLRADVIDKKALEGGAAAPTASGEGAHEIVNCGAPFPEHEIAVVDDAGARLGDRRVGHILARGPSVSPGYHEEPELTRESFRDGWLYTGDLGYTVDGELFVCGRQKDIIIVRGRNFYPSDIEWLVGELPGVRRGNVVAFGIELSGSGGGEERLVVAAEGARSEAEALRVAISQAVTASLSLTVHDVVVVPQGTLPRTSSGKPQRRKTRELYLSGELARARRVHAEPNNDGISA